MTKDGPPVPHVEPESELFQRLKNRYFAARFIEIASVLEVLLSEGVLKNENLQRRVVELGAGSGIGLVALRKYASGVLQGIDSGTYYNNPNIGYSGSFAIPTAPLLEAAEATFHRDENISFLEKQPALSVSLLATFYMESKEWQPAPLLYAAGRVLVDGGQFLMTSDRTMELPKVSWGEGPLVFDGEKGPHNQSLILPVPEWIRKNYRAVIHFARGYLEDEIQYDDAASVGCVRDQNIVVYTKTAK